MPVYTGFPSRFLVSRTSCRPPSRWRQLWRILPFLILVVLCGCDKSSQKSDSPSEIVLAPIQAQVKALNKRDAKAAVAMMHPDAPGLDQTRETTEKVTATYDLIFMIQNLTLESVDENEAKVRFTQMTQKAAGPEFRNNRVTGVHTLRKYEGAWRIYSTETLKIEYLD